MARQESEPAQEGISEVVPGVLRMQLPVPFAGLGHVNCYALPDDRGVALVDPGMPGDRTWDAIGHRLEQAGFAPKDVHTVVVTHGHPDHFGQVVRFEGADVVTHASFPSWTNFLNKRTPWGSETKWQASMTMRTAPKWMRWAAKVAGPRVMERVLKLPDPTSPQADGGRVILGGRAWTAVHTPGHTGDHICLHDEDSGVLMTGDHVLPSITPHISGMGAEADPVRSFLDSLEKVANLEVTLALPAHGHPFQDLSERARSIAKHHEERLEKIRSIGRSAGRALNVMEVTAELFPPRHQGRMAESETYAHLEHLRLDGRAERHEEAGVLFYETAG
ncbi:MAG TPA: MBL fold metallo-hydrolase [Aeromicrobium sp.]|nr:MBL fold metallo-hydrolase [Aeromicrobium sp.]